MKIGAGNYNKTLSGSLDVSEIIIHENFENNGDFRFENDIALIHLSEPVRGITPINYQISTEPVAGTASEVVGWGQLTIPGDTSDDLRIVESPIVDRDVCNAPNSYDGDLTTNMLCAGFLEGGKSPCIHDSGGPLMANDTVVGLVSWGRGGCGAVNLPVIYTNVANYVQWIDEKIEDNTTILPTSTVYETAHPYADNTTEEKVLSIDNAEVLFVTIEGIVEANYDFIYITDENGVETAFTGELTETFEVIGSSITVRFESDGSVTNEGVIVTISE